MYITYDIMTVYVETDGRVCGSSWYERSDWGSSGSTVSVWAPRRPFNSGRRRRRGEEEWPRCVKTHSVGS